MRRLDTGFPKCKNEDCFACKIGYCIILTESYGDKTCPFYKSRKEITMKEIEKGLIDE